MTELHEELLAIADELDQLAERALRPEIEVPLAGPQQAAEEVGRASSGSWLGHHANVYYDDFMQPPPGTHFSQEWGSIDTFGEGTRGAWVEFAREDVESAMRERAGNPDLQPANALREQAVREFYSEARRLFHSGDGGSRPHRQLSEPARRGTGRSVDCEQAANYGAYIDNLTVFTAAPCCRMTPSANPTYEGPSVSGRSD